MLMLLTAKRPHPPRPPFRVMDGWMDGRMDGWMDGWMDGRTDGRTDALTFGFFLGAYSVRKSSQESIRTQQIPDNFYGINSFLVN